MRDSVRRILTTAGLMAVGLFDLASAQTARWTEQKANDWYAEQPWLVGD